jgi:Protein of unknown function (DUF1553)/Protein of unknown function (DUF1549)/Planctomycete cytochrome C
MTRRLFFLAGLLLASDRLVAAEPVDYVREIRPLLRARCYACHGALKQQAKLRVDSGANLLKGGRHGAAVRSGDPAGSLLLERVSDTEEGTRMPPEGQPLTVEQIAKLKAWIEQGARVPADDKAEEDPRDHWAFRRPVRPALPAVTDPAWGRNPIDVFLAVEHARHGLAANPPADKAHLLRRVYLDLIGLPPTRQELHAFLADDTPGAYERVVERLLASPQYGERWARHWMDIWRYSDWYGRRSVPDVMNSYARIFRWRDWIARSLNEDKGYDRMVLEMLAADEICPDDDANVVATGFLVRNWFKWNYHQWMKDNVEHTAKAFLGLTLNCCHCHDHKYDPITNEEYFRFRAFFEPLELRHDRVPGEPDPGPFQKYLYGVSYGPIQGGMVRVFDEKLDAQTFVYARGEERNRIDGRPPVTPGVPAALGGDRLKVEPVALPPTAWYPGLKRFVQEEETAKRQAAVAAAEARLTAARVSLAAAEQRLTEAEAVAWCAQRTLPPVVVDTLARREAAHEDAQGALRVAEAQADAARSERAALRARIAADRARYLGGPGDPDELARRASQAECEAASDTCRVLQARGEQLAAIIRRKPANQDQLAKAAQQLVAAQKAAASEALKAASAGLGKYQPLSPTYPKTSTGRRAVLARWIASKDNPLTARVAVNHLWRWHFGMPLVETTFDFGRNGKRPSHPELLDWLATELMDNGWRMKPLHRLIVTSAAYRMRSHVGGTDHPGLAIDPDNRWLWHFPARRMEAEVVRDGVLHAAGELDLTMGGVEIPHEQGLTSRRRSLYFAHHGESKMEFLELFDAANPCDCYKRTASVLPQQALALSNSELAERQGRLLAGKLTAEAGSEEAFVRVAFEQVLGRGPTEPERAASVAFLGRQRRLFPGGELRARENFVQALFNHNDFVTVR